MKKTLLAVAVAVVVGGVVLGLYGVRAGWWGRNPPGANVPPPPEPLPALVERLDAQIGSGERKQASEGYAELGKPETLKRLLAAVDDAAQPVPLRQRALLLLARAQGHIKDMAPVLLKHAGDPASPLRPQAVTALAGLPELAKLDADGSVTVSLSVAAGAPDGQLRLPATQGLARLKSKAAVQALVERLADQDVAVRKAAMERLKALAGQDFGYSCSRAPSGQKEAIERWRFWSAAYQPKP